MWVEPGCDLWQVATGDADVENLGAIAKSHKAHIVILEIVIYYQIFVNELDHEIPCSYLGKH
jgi:hypothetical protein